jgi:N-acetyl-anhydromuramyl-L-alanine amidase AmpD
MLVIHDYTKQAGFGYIFGRTKSIDALVIHHTSEGKTVENILNIFKRRRLPAHYVMDRKGIVYRTLPYHAKGQHILNSYGKFLGYGNKNTEGIEVIAKDNNNWSKDEINNILSFIIWHQSKYQYTLNRVFGHGELNPNHREANEGMVGVNIWRKYIA